MTPEEFRAHAHELVDWMADYLAEQHERAVVPDTRPGEVRAQLPERAPEHGEPFAAIFDDFRRLILPHMTHWNHPGWFAYFPANHSPPSVLAEMLMATLGAQCMSWQTSPAATELEQVVMQWLGDLVGLPDTFTGVIQDTASTATLVALLSARERATAGGFGAQGASAPDAGRLTVYATAHAHSSIDKAVKLAGYGLQNLQRVPVDESCSMRPEALDAMIRADLASGRVPAAVVATVGTTSTAAVDPLDAISAVCAEHGVWLHVDAAYAGSAGIVPELRHHFKGIERADSVVFNPHKWMLVNFDCSAYYVRDVDALLRTFALTPEYLRTAHDDEVVNFRDWGVQLGRRFRALKLWFVLRSYGAEGLRALLRDHVRWAHELASWVEDDPRFELMAPARFGLVCFRYNPPGAAHDEDALNSLNRALLASVNAHGDVHLTHTSLDGAYTIRVSVGQWKTRAEDVARAWQHVLAAADDLATPLR